MEYPTTILLKCTQEGTRFEMICVGIPGDAYIRGYGVVMKLDGDHETGGRDRKSSDRKFMECLSTRRAARD